MVKVTYNDQLVYKVLIWAIFGITLWKEKVALILMLPRSNVQLVDQMSRSNKA